MGLAFLEWFLVLSFSTSLRLPYQGTRALGIKNDLIVFGCSQYGEQSVWREKDQEQDNGCSAKPRAKFIFAFGTRY